MTHCLGSFWRVMRPLWASVTPEIPMPAKTVRARIHPRLRLIHPPILHLQRVQLKLWSLVSSRTGTKASVSEEVRNVECGSAREHHLGEGCCANDILGGQRNSPSWPGGVDATSREISRSFL